jgi:hypothetical protein
MKMLMDSKKQHEKFSSATWEDCRREDGLEMNVQYVWNESLLQTLYIPQDFPPAVLCVNN